MHFATSVIALAASAAVSSAASVTFWTLDDVERTIHFVPSSGADSIDDVVVSGAENTTVRFPSKWNGNFYAVAKGQQDKKAGMLGEVQFGGWRGNTYFDVSAIVDDSDHNNVKQMWPKGRQYPMSGCETFPCDNCYKLPDDVQTKVTNETELFTTLGSGATGLKFSK